MEGTSGDPERQPDRDMVEVTITDSRRSWLPWRHRVVTGRCEYLLTTGEALHAAEVLDARGATEAADNLRSVVLSRILEPDPGRHVEVTERRGFKRWKQAAKN